MEIVINGKNHTASKPKAKIWREIMKFDEERTQLPNAEFIDKHAEIIASVFPDVTAVMIIDNVDIDEIVPLYYEVFKWICGLLNSKLRKLPNAQTPAEN